MKSLNTSLLVIASYPPKDSIHHAAIVGGASYTKNTLLAIQKIAEKTGEELDITVLAEKLDNTVIASEARQSPGGQEIASPLRGLAMTYEDAGVTVKRIWQRNSLASFFSLAREAQSDKILFSLELAMFGGKLSLIGLALLLLWLKVTGKHVFVVMHQVIADISELEGHLGTSSPSLLNKINNFALRQFYNVVLFSSYKTIVFEETFKESLLSLRDHEVAKQSTSDTRLPHFARNDGYNDKIIVIPHGVETFNSTISKAEARQHLDIAQETKVILLFGFLAWYKGTDWIVDIADKQMLKEKNIHIIIAGGANPNRLELSFYRDYLDRLEKTAKEKNITITGFVPEDKIAMYFQAADLVIFPYRALMSSSGPLSMALSFGTPLLLADKLKPLTKTADFQDALAKTDLQQNALFFSLDEAGFNRIQERLSDNALMDKARTFATLLATSRSWEKIGRMYYEVLTI